MFADSGCLNILLIQCMFARAEWIDKVNSTMIYERKPSSQMHYVRPITHILGKLPLVPVGDTGIFPHSMRRESAKFPGSHVTQTPARVIGADGGMLTSGP